MNFWEFQQNSSDWVKGVATETALEKKDDMHVLADSFSSHRSAERHRHVGSCRYAASGKCMITHIWSSTCGLCTEMLVRCLNAWERHGTGSVVSVQGECTCSVSSDIAYVCEQHGALLKLWRKTTACVTAISDPYKIFGTSNDKILLLAKLQKLFFFT